MADTKLRLSNDEKEEIFQMHKKLEDTYRKGHNGRLHEEKDGKYRPAGNRDCRRVDNSNHFYRLQGKMQLWDQWPGSFHQNRLTHSMQCANQAKDIAQLIHNEMKSESKHPEWKSVYDEREFVESTSKAHDLGNPSFGHRGEKVLHELAKDIGGFEGNAQTLRILTELEAKNPGMPGLNLMIRTLLGVTKYYRTVYQAAEANGGLEKASKFIYLPDYKILAPFTEGTVRSLDAQVMDLADDIANMQGDLGDSLKIGLSSASELKYFLQTKYKSVSSYFETMVTKAKKHAEGDPKNRQNNPAHSPKGIDFYFRRKLQSILVNELIHDIGLVPVDNEKKTLTGTTNKYELGFKKLGPLVEGINNYIFETIIKGEQVTSYEIIGEKVIRTLYQIYQNPSLNKDSRLLPVEYRPRRMENGQFEGDEMRLRRVVDYISGMTDSYAIDRYIKLTGEDPTNGIFKGIMGQKVGMGKE